MDRYGDRKTPGAAPSDPPEPRPRTRQIDCTEGPRPRTEEQVIRGRGAPDPDRGEPIRRAG